MKKMIIAVALAAALVVTGVVPAFGSSHREAPLISNDPVADNTDVYMFRSPDAPDTVTIIANFIPFEEPAGGPNFYRFGDNVLYQIHVFNNRDNATDITYQFKFNTVVRNKHTFLYNTGPITSLDDPDFNIQQFYTVTQVRDGKAAVLGWNLPTPPVNIGPKSTPNYETLANEAIKPVRNGIKVFAGQRDDPFYVDLGGTFDLLTIRKPPGNTGGGVDGLAGFNTHTIAMQIPIKQLTANRSVPTDPLDPNAAIGVYAGASRQHVKVLIPGKGKTKSLGRFSQISRLGEPLINEVIIPLGGKNMWNATYPVNDRRFLMHYRDPELAKLLTALFNISVPPAPRNDLVAILLQGFSLEPLGIKFSNVGGPAIADLIRLNVAVPPKKSTDPGFHRFGLHGGDLAGFPNGRRLEDDVVDVELQAIAGATAFTPDFNKPPNNQLGDGVNANDLPFLASFPYAATPHPGFEHSHHRVEP